MTRTADPDPDPTSIWRRRGHVPPRERASERAPPATHAPGAGLPWGSNSSNSCCARGWQALSLVHVHASCSATCFTHVRPCLGYNAFYRLAVFTH
ncbi:hypothetical protein SORBI_3005G210350 [Sorghum bicolor]|uniref:Uncharacterized protein n=1 Tax=Sorghum bicolor TaxID=4558 RepID=A0A1Z5RJT0_SORBI|nr:hypothetical protein SORBI_3005G210350 [Sorghum bicolor]